MNTKELIKSVKREARHQAQHHDLVCAAFNRNEERRHAPEGEAIPLTEAAAKLGLLFFDDLKGEVEDIWLGTYQGGFSFSDKRFRLFKENYREETLWDEFEDLLVFLFGTERAPLVKTAWQRAPELPYQTGYLRRSFRAPRAADQITLTRLNMVRLMMAEMTYDIPMTEAILHDQELHGQDATSFLWAIAIDNGDEALLTLLTDIVYNRHPLGKVSRAHIKALLRCDNESAWKAVTDLLLSAQRQEGLRQTIMECLDETSLGAMRHLIKVVIDEKLCRFSAVVRALDVWCGLGWEAEKEATVRRFMALGYKYLSDPALIEGAMETKDNAEIYMALWAQATIDVDGCTPLLERLYKTGNREKRCLALYFVDEIKRNTLRLHFAKASVSDPDLAVFYFSLLLLNSADLDADPFDHDTDGADLFSKIARRIEEIPKAGKTFEGILFSWLSYTLEQSHAYRALVNLTRNNHEGDIRRVLPLFTRMSLSEREALNASILADYGAYRFDEEKARKAELTPIQRELAFMGIKDRGEWIRGAAIRALKYAEVRDDELPVFEEMLRRKNPDLRRSIIELVLNKTTAQIQQVTTHLIRAKNLEQRLAGLDLLNQLKAGVLEDWVDAMAAAFAKRPGISVKEQILLDNLTQRDAAVHIYTKENGFGLYDPAHITPVETPTTPTEGLYADLKKAHPFGLSMPASEINAAVKDLHALLLTHKDYEYETENWDGSMEAVLLGNDFSAIRNDEKEMSPEERYNNYPLPEVWKGWFEGSALTPCDLFLINLNATLGVEDEDDDDEDEKSLFPKTRAELAKLIFIPKIPKVGEYTWRNPLVSILRNLAYIFPFEHSLSFLEGLIKDAFARVHPDDLHRIATQKGRWDTYYHVWPDLNLLKNAYEAYSNQALTMSDARFTALWPLMKWRYSVVPDDYKSKDRYHFGLAECARAFALERITEDELYARVMQSDAISELTAKPRKGELDYFARFPFLKEILDPCRDRILEIELNRGDSSTAVTLLAQELRQIFGGESFVKILEALGKETLHRGYISSWGNREYNKKEVLSTLLKRCRPSKDEPQAAFDKRIKASGVTKTRLIEAAIYAPQWLPFIEPHLEMKGMASAVWWLHAHTNADHTAETETEIGRFSPVDMKDFEDGAVDTEWFLSAYKQVGKASWKVLYNGAKYVSDGGKHSRAKLYADVMLGNTKITEVKKRIRDKRNQDYVRVLGLVPLSRKKRETDLLNRYKLLQEFKKESKKFGSQRQASEGLSVRIAMENLARTAGYADPIRLSWAMETEEAVRIMGSAKTLQFGSVTIALDIDENGQSAIVCRRDEKPLRSIPAKLNKEKAVVDLKSFHKALKEMYRRTRHSLEVAMVNGEVFTQDEIMTLTRHPVIQPMLSTLVFRCEDRFGFLQGDELRTPRDETHPIEGDATLAHCTDLHRAGIWSDYQRYCFEKSIQQPFKQVFRELYVPTPDELAEKTVSRRYAGHQVQPRKTVALLKGRGWTVDYEEGLQKVFHKRGFIAKMFAMADWFSPADVESPTLETVAFIDRKTFKRIPFEDIDPRIFSEIMRDVDLVVSVAHVGDVDPEASHSTIEMRAALVTETARLFKLDNVRVDGRHVRIDGALGAYSVHLGSAVCHKVPGVYLSILPVHSQHRGRLFLPFVDDDPKSAEVMSKVLLLAKDGELRDPTILSQIRAAD